MLSVAREGTRSRLHSDVQVRRGRDREDDTVRTVVEPEGLPLVLVAAADPTFVKDLRRLLRGHAEVGPAADPTILRLGLEARPAAVVLDGGLPAADSLAAVAAHVERPVWIVAWGPTGGMTATLDRAGSPWIGCQADAPLGHVASICLMLLTEPSRSTG